MTNQPLHIIIVAAGTGSRFGAALPKQFCVLSGRPILMHAIDRLRAYCPDALITIVISKEMENLWLTLCSEYQFVSPRIVYGGDTRWCSVKNAMFAQGSPEDGLTIVHDGARPIVKDDVVKRLINVMDDETNDGAVTVMAVTDSLREIQPDGSLKSVDRAQYRAVQTPQIFRTALLRKAYTLPYQSAFTDDASVMEAAGFSHIAAVEGSEATIKITRPHDIEVAALYLRDSQI
jgi:2-C-methyl-D-erythritol 4-phosphate cytidylyltransferase